MSDTLLIANARVLTAEGWRDGDVLIESGRVAAIGTGFGAPAQVDAAGGLLLPGIVDLHGDAFERHITPRPGVHFPVEMALAANDGGLIAAGITTFFYSITDGFEPGPRSRETCRALVEAVEALRPRMAADARLHIRHEVVATDGHDELMGWLRDGRIDLLSLNDHLPPLDNAEKKARYLKGLRRRVPMNETEEETFLHSLQDRRSLGRQQVEALAALAAEHGISVASHDDRTEEDHARALGLGVAIAEFPHDIPLCARYRAEGIHTLMGAPNLVRGGSHVGAVSVREAVADGAVDILVSDYHYPSLLRAPFLLAELDILPLAEAWALVSTVPAQAAGLTDRGIIAEGRRADLLLLESGARGLSLDLQAVVCGGRMIDRRSADDARLAAVG